MRIKREKRHSFEWRFKLYLTKTIRIKLVYIVEMRLMEAQLRQTRQRQLRGQFLLQASA